MRRSLSVSPFHLLQAFFFSAPYTLANIHEHEHDPDLFSFSSRPDIRAPRWKVEVKRPDLVTPGYWFLAPFEFIDQREPGHGWIGPHIYDGNGDLVWSGVHQVNNTDVLDFKYDNVNGQQRMIYQSQHAGNGYILDETFEIQQTIDLGVLREDFNSHEFSFIHNGSRAFSMTEGRRLATADQVMAVEWPPEKDCRAIFNGFKVWDTTKWEKIWEWSSFDHIGLNESSFHDGPQCGERYGWDFVHLNSVDVDQNGDYYVSARHADVIYKVSKDDGHIIWRLHGRNEPWGDFDMGDVRFRRQHNVRFRGFNGTHEIITILDNGKGEDSAGPSYRNSRGLTLALDTQSPNMTARYVMAIDHPDGEGAFAFRRGNYQVLDNGHIFIGWSEQAMHSEHDSDGTLIMEARLKTHWLGTYRSYKFPLVGRPSEPPVAVSAAYPSPDRNSTTTLAHVSWNGATEVASWNLYKTTETGQPEIKIFNKPKRGFETTIAWDGYAAYVFAEALDARGNVLGRSNIAKTREPPAEGMSSAVAEEEYWLQEMAGQNQAWTNRFPAGSKTPTPKLGSSIFIFSVLLALCIVIFAIGKFFAVPRLRSSGLKMWRYEALSEQDQEQEYSEQEQFYK